MLLLSANFLILQPELKQNSKTKLLFNPRLVENPNFPSLFIPLVLKGDVLNEAFLPPYTILGTLTVL
jgi:hypothetical protein